MNNPLFEGAREVLRNLQPDKAEKIKQLLAKRMQLAQYGPNPPLSSQLIADRLKQYQP